MGTGKNVACFNNRVLANRADASGFLSLAEAAKSIIFVATKFFLSRQTRVCRDKTRLLWRQKHACRDKTFVATKYSVATKCLSRRISGHTNPSRTSHVICTRQNSFSTSTTKQGQTHFSLKNKLKKSPFIWRKKKRKKKTWPKHGGINLLILQFSIQICVAVGSNSHHASCCAVVYFECRTH